MFDMITKTDLFQWADRQVPIPRRNNLKDFQDAFIMSQIGDVKGQRILEMGGGDSRVLRHLSRDNECWNLEIFEGKDGGPAKEVKIPGVRNVIGLLGQFRDDLPESYFDCVFSVSVVEHIPDSDLPNVFRDAARILKPGGLFIHAIDMYLLDETHAIHPRNDANNNRLRLMLDFSRDDFEFVEEPRIERDLYFRTSFVTNAHLAMLDWNKVAPALRPLREIAEAASIKMILRRR